MATIGILGFGSVPFILESEKGALQKIERQLSSDVDARIEAISQILSEDAQ